MSLKSSSVTSRRGADPEEPGGAGGHGDQALGAHLLQGAVSRRRRPRAASTSTPPWSRSRGRPRTGWSIPVQNPDGAHQWIFSLSDDSCCVGSAYSWTFDASWHCAEWYVDVSAKSYRFFSDSTEVTSLAFTNNTNAKMSSYTAIVVGSIFYQTPPSPFVLWLDDLALNDTQIGCK